MVPGRAGGATSIQPGSPSVCPARLEPPAVREPGPCRAEPIDLGLDQASVRVHAGSRGASQAVGCSPSSLAVPTLLTEKDGRQAWSVIGRRAGAALMSPSVARVLEGLVTAAVRHQLNI